MKTAASLQAAPNRPDPQLPANLGYFALVDPEPPLNTKFLAMNEHIDLATAYFQSDTLAPPNPGEKPHGKFELKLELFKPVLKPDGTVDKMERIDLTAAGVKLYEVTQEAPFTIQPSSSPHPQRPPTTGSRQALRLPAGSAGGQPPLFRRYQSGHGGGT